MTDTGAKLQAGCRAFTHMACSYALSAVTLVPLWGFVVGDKRPSLVATALQMFVAGLLATAALVFAVLERQNTRRPTDIDREASRSE